MKRAAVLKNWVPAKAPGEGGNDVATQHVDQVRRPTPLNTRPGPYDSPKPISTYRGPSPGVPELSAPSASRSLILSSLARPT